MQRSFLFWEGSVPPDVQQSFSIYHDWDQSSVKGFAAPPSGAQPNLLVEILADLPEGGESAAQTESKVYLRGGLPCGNIFFFSERHEALEIFFDTKNLPAPFGNF